MQIDKIVSKRKLFIENLLIYGFGSVLSKITPLLMLPVISRIVQDPKLFAIADLFYIAVSFLSPIAIAGTQDSVFREYFEKEDESYQRKVLSSALLIVIISTSIILIGISFFHKTLAILIFNENGYEWLIFFLLIQIFLSSFESIFHRPTRLNNKRKQIIIVNLTSSLMSYSVSIPMIIFVNPLFGLIMSRLIDILIKSFIYFFLNKKCFNLKLIDKSILKKLLSIGIPLIPTFTIYWVFKAVDRIMIVSFLGYQEAGIYAMGAKVASITSIIQIGFSQGWSFFAFRTMNSTNQVKMISNLVNIWLFITIMVFSISSVVVNQLWSIVIGGYYNGGESVVPLLSITPLLLVVFQTISTQMLIIRKSYIITLSLISGLICNVILNYFLILKFGIRGAAIATVSGYMISLLLSIVISSRYNLLILNKRLVINSILLFTILVYSIMNIPFVMGCLFSILVIFLCFIVNYSYVKSVISAKAMREYF